MSKSALINCIERINTGNWKFIQLRGTKLSVDDIDNGDVDLLGSTASIKSLIMATYQWVKNSDCHVHVSTRRPCKTMLVIYSIDGEHSLTLDLWSAIPQLSGTKHSLVFDDVANLYEDATDDYSLRRLPIEIEACIYIHHLWAKRKDITANYIKERLARYIQQCTNENVVESLKGITKNNNISKASLKVTLDILQSSIKNIKEPAMPKLYPFHLKAKSKNNFLCIMGCDGVGKTSLSENVAKSIESEIAVYKGKHLYRKSIVYKLAVILIRPLLFQSREKFDESLAGFVYLRACFGLWCKQISNNKLMLIDRNLVDFLCLDRKTDKPRWSVMRWFSSLAGNRIPTVHCIADFQTISKRKLEITEKGHSIYDSMMFSHLACRIPTEYTLFNNQRDLEESRQALLNIIQTEDYPISSGFKIRKNTT